MSKEIEEYVVDKRKELIWALAQQKYNTRQVGFIFGISRARAHVIMNEMPEGWVSPWKKYDR